MLRTKKMGGEVSVSMRRMLMVVTRLMSITLPIKNSKKNSKKLNNFKEPECPVKK